MILYENILKQVWIFFIGSMAFFVTFLSIGAIIKNRRENSLLSRLIFNWNSSLPAAEADSQSGRQSTSEIILTQIDYVLTIITSQGSIFDTLQ